MSLKHIELDPQTRDFYCQAIDVLQQARIPFLIGGTFAFERYTGIARQTKDLDIFVHPQDVERTLKIFSQAGYDTELSVSHWLGKASRDRHNIDLIVKSATDEIAVDEIWFERAVTDRVLGIPVQLCSPEEMIWTGAFVMARDRFDGADIAHLILTCSDRLDWQHLLTRFDKHWRVLFSHLILFGFIYPGERSRIPDWIMYNLSQRLQLETNNAPPQEKLCQGTLLAPLQYQIDVEQWGYKDARIRPTGNLIQPQIAQWTNHLKEEKGIT